MKKMSKLENLINTVKEKLGLKDSEQSLEEHNTDSPPRVTVSRTTKTEEMREMIKIRRENDKLSEFDSPRNRIGKAIGQFKIDKRIETRLDRPSEQADSGGWAVPNYIVNYEGIYTDSKNQVWLEYSNNMKTKYIKVCGDLFSEDFDGQFVLINPFSGE